MRTRGIFIIALVGMLHATSYCQPFYSHNEVGLSIGSSNISGDISNQSSPTTLLKELRAMGGFSYFRALNSEQAIGFELKSLSYFASDLNHLNPQRGIQVFGAAQFISMQIRHTFFGNFPIKFKPYAKIGVGFFRFSSSVSTPESSLFLPTKTASGLHFAMEVLPGIKFQWRENQSFSLEAVLIFSNRDDWDVLFDEARTIDKIGGIRFVYSVALFR